MKSHVDDYDSTRCESDFAGGWKPKICVVLGLKGGLYIKFKNNILYIKRCLILISTRYFKNGPKSNLCEICFQNQNEQYRNKHHRKSLTWVMKNPIICI